MSTDADRFCLACDADLIGNDPHAEGCSEDPDTLALEPNPHATRCDCGHGPLAHLRDSKGRAGYGRCCACTYALEDEDACVRFSTKGQDRDEVRFPEPGHTPSASDYDPTFGERVR
jgi:hypothetical protein